MSQNEHAAKWISGIEENLLTWKSIGNNCHETFLTGVFVVYECEMLFVLWCSWCQFHHIQAMEKESRSMKAWERITSLRGTGPQRGRGKEWREREEWGTLNWKEGEMRRARKKGNFNSLGQFKNPLVFYPHEKTRRQCLAPATATLAFHIDWESKWAAKTLPPSQLIHCLFFCLHAHRVVEQRRGTFKKN